MFYLYCIHEIQLNILDRRILFTHAGDFFHFFGSRESQPQMIEEIADRQVIDKRVCHPSRFLRGFVGIVTAKSDCKSRCRNSQS